MFLAKSLLNVDPARLDMVQKASLTRHKSAPPGDFIRADLIIIPLNASDPLVTRRRTPAAVPPNNTVILPVLFTFSHLPFCID